MAIELKIVDPPRVELSASGGEHLRFGMDEGTQYRDYDDLLNRPEINGVTLTGDKSGADLGLQDALTFDTEPTEGSTNPVTSDGIYRAIGGASGKLYIVTYGVTTYAEIVEAYQSGMFPVMIRGNSAFIMQSHSITGNEIIFSATPGEVNPVGTSFVSGYKVTAANAWSLWTGYFQTIGGRVTAISASSTDAQYPTARAVYSALSEKADASDLAGKQDAPLVGTTQTVTYSDMVQAISAGQDIQITHTDNTYGVFTFVDGWVYSPALGVIGGNGIFNFGGGLLLGQLICTSDGWAFLATYLATSDDINGLWTVVSDKIGGGDVPTYEQDPTVPAWAKAANKPTYNPAEIGAQPAGNYAAAKAGDTTAAALATASIPFAQVDSTSTSTVFTATVPGITEYRDGVSFWLRNGKVTSAAGFTININGLGAKKVFSNMAPTTQDTTLFNSAYTMLFVYCEWLDNGAGGFLQYRGYDANTNTLGYQIRTNSYSLPMQSVTYRYRLLFRSADGSKFVPANNSTSTNATSSRTVNQTPIDPHGQIVYYGTTAAVTEGNRPSAANLWTQYIVTIGYSFNRTGAEQVMTPWTPVYIKAEPQADGSAIIDADTPYVQALPTTADGKIYIYLGVAVERVASGVTHYDTLEIEMNHPIYHYYNGAIRRWVGPI